MKQLLSSIFARYGQMAILSHQGEEMAAQVFFWSINSVSQRNGERLLLPLGRVPVGEYVCILPADVQAQADDTLELEQRQYVIRKVEPMSWHAGAVCQWALCARKGSEDTWGTNGLNG